MSTGSADCATRRLCYKGPPKPADSGATAAPGERLGNGENDIAHMAQEPAVGGAFGELRLRFPSKQRPRKEGGVAPGNSLSIWNVPTMRWNRIDTAPPGFGAWRTWGLRILARRGDRDAQFLLGHACSVERVSITKWKPDHVFACVILCPTVGAVELLFSDIPFFAAFVAVQPLFLLGGLLGDEHEFGFGWEAATTILPGTRSLINHLVEDRVEDRENSKNESESLRWYLKAAENGHMGAQYVIGTYYHRGWRGIRQDDAKAFRWMRKATDQGYVPAQYYLGWMYMKGRGVQKNLAEAEHWLKEYIKNIGIANKISEECQIQFGGMMRKGKASEKELKKVLEAIEKWFRMRNISRDLEEC